MMHGMPMLYMTYMYMYMYMYAHMYMYSYIFLPGRTNYRAPAEPDFTDVIRDMFNSEKYVSAKPNSPLSHALWWSEARVGLLA